MKLLKSRTNWLILIAFLVAGINGVQDAMSPALFDLIIGALGVLAIYFKMNPSQSYGK